MVVDVFRAFSAAAYAFAASARRIVLAEEVDEATALAASTANTILMGEVGGVRPPAFDLGNSPGEILADPESVAGKTVVHRSSSGTRCARAALVAGAAPLYVASLVVGSATARALREADQVTIVAAGLGGIEAAEEDEACAGFIAAQLLGEDADTEEVGRQVATSDRARYLDRAEFTHADDVRLCSTVDRFDFAMRASPKNGLLVVRREDA